MGKKYIIELPESWVDIISDESEWLKVPVTVADKKVVINTTIPLTPYTEPDAEEAYQRGLNDAWEAAKKNYLPEDHGGLGYKTRMKVFDTDNIGWIFKNLSASEAIEKIRAYEEKKETEEAKKETEIKVEDVMRQYLDIFCNSHRCNKCPLHTPEFTCGRGKHFLSLPHNRVSDEEVRRAYAKVMKENNND